ncbi:MAG: hypothetical protein ACLP6G_17245 [Terriglobales bacterium]
MILDTGPIRELVCYHAVHQLRFHRLSGELGHFKNREAYDSCSHFLGSFPHKLTSASVVAELYNWIKRTDRDGQSRLWGQIYDEFRNMGMDEEVVKLLEMPIDLVTHHGPVDVSLLKLAEQHRPRHAVILTLDSWLWNECQKARIDSRLLSQVCHSGE